MPGPIYPPKNPDLLHEFYRTAPPAGHITPLLKGDPTFPIATDLKPEYLEGMNVNMKFTEGQTIHKATGIHFREDSNTVPTNLVEAVKNIERAFKAGTLSSDAGAKAYELLDQWTKRPTYISNNRITIDGVQQPAKDQS